MDGRFRTLYERSPFKAYAVDERSRVVAVTDMLLERLGYERDELLGRPADELMAPVSRKYVQRVARPQFERDGFIDRIPLEFVTKGGTPIEVLFSARRLYAADGAPVGAVASLRDFEGEHHALEEMQREKLRFRTLTDALPFLVARIDSSHRYRFVNKTYARTFGTPISQILGRHVSEFVDPDVVESLLPTYARAMDGETLSLQKTSRLVDGRVREMRLTYLPDPVPDDGPGLFFVGQDVTEWTQELEERAALEKKVLKAQHLEALGLLAGGVAHDFNNLLTGILSNAEVATLDVVPGSEASEALTDVITAAKRASELTRQLLTYAGRHEVEPVRLCLNQLADEVLKLLRHSLDGLDVVRELDPAEPGVLGDRSQLGRVLMNLVTNAADAMAGQGCLTIRTGTTDAVAGTFAGATVGADVPAGGYAWVEVADTGGGIPEEHRESIFEPFFSTKEDNHGLGLAALTGAVRSHGGVLQIQTEVGRGSTFRVSLPAAEPAAPPTPVPRASPLQGRALLVDDQPLILRSLQRQLQRLGLEVTTAGDGAEAVGIFERDPGFDLVILDVVMPVMDGPEAMRRIRALRADVPVVMLSGFHDRELDVSEADAFLPKPCSAGALRTVLAELL